MTKIKTEYDSYTKEKLLINLVDDIFRIEDIDSGQIFNLKYAILTVNGEDYITYSKVIIDQLKSYDFINKLVVMKEFSTDEFRTKKYHKLYVVGYL